MSENLTNTQSGIRKPALLLAVASLVQLIAAFLPSSRVFTAPDPLEKMQAIAANPAGWNLQAVLFPLAFLLVTIGFGWLTRTFMVRSARIAGWVATTFSFTAFICWIPISVSRLKTGLEIDQLIAEYPAGTSFDLNGGIPYIFWVYTITALLSVGVIGLAIFLAGIRKTTGIIATGISLLSLILVIPLWQDWPPLFTYFILLIMAISLLLPGKGKLV